MNNIKFKNKFLDSSSKSIDFILKTNKAKNTKTKVDTELNCFKNFIIEFLSKKKIVTSSLIKFYKMLPKQVLQNKELLLKTLVDLNDDGYILIKKDLVKLMIINNDKHWIPLPCNKDTKDDFQELAKDEQKISKVKLSNDDITQLDNRVFTMLLDENNKMVPVKNITSAQVDAIDKATTIQNIMIDVFINEYLDRDKKRLNVKKVIILKELASYNLWALKNKREQFFHDDENEHTVFIKKQIEKDLKNNISKAIFTNDDESRAVEQLDSDRKIEHEVKVLFKQKGWKEVKESILANYTNIFSFLY